jgi:hypothetical protein
MHMAPQVQVPGPASPVATQIAQQQPMTLRAAEQSNIPILALKIRVETSDAIYEITVDNYGRERHIWLQLLQYWQLVLNEKLQKGGSNGIALEVKTIVELQNDLKHLSATSESDLLIQYLVDNLLIKLEIERISQSQDVRFLQASNYVVGRLEEFKASIGVSNYQTFARNIPEIAIQDALKALIRRYHFIQSIDQTKDGWKKWLSKARKHTRYGYQKVSA